MAISRYELARKYASGRRVLEVACGSGQGLGYVAAVASRVVGGDITNALLRQARDHYRGSIPLVRFDAHALPFAPASFDIVELHEAIYYMADARAVLTEIRRVLRSGGLLIVSSINPAWLDFNPSPHATRYFNAAELKTALESTFSTVDIRFGFAVDDLTLLHRGIALLKRTAVRLRLIPRTMRSKALLKRVFLGPLLPVPPELTAGLAPVDEPVAAPITESSRFRTIYAMARV
jgi:ubiquinone/menaquinone biosynthesis C-methylase UbiE